MSPCGDAITQGRNEIAMIVIETRKETKLVLLCDFSSDKNCTSPRIA